MRTRDVSMPALRLRKPCNNGFAAMANSRKPRVGRIQPARPLELVWTERAINDLEGIGDYVAMDNPAAAEHWVTALVDAANRVGDAPLAGRRVAELGRDDIRELLKRQGLAMSDRCMPTPASLAAWRRGGLAPSRERAMFPASDGPCVG